MESAEEGKMEMEVDKKKPSGRPPSILLIGSGPVVGRKLGESSRESNDKEKHVTVLKVRPGTAHSKGGSMHMESVKLKNDLVHFMCIICNARFSTRDECNEHVSRSHATSGGSMCPALRCIGSLKDYLQSSRSKRKEKKIADYSPLSKYKKRQLSPSSSQQNKGRSKNTQASRSSASAKKTNRRSTTAIRNSLSAKNAKKSKKLASAKTPQSDVVIVWNTDEMVNTKYKRYGYVIERLNATYMCFHCHREFPAWVLCRRHIVKAHPFLVLKPMASAKTADKRKHPMDERGTSSEGRNGKVAESKKAVQAGESSFADGSMSLADEHGSNNRQVKKQHPNVDDLLKLSAHILAFPELDGKFTEEDFKYLDISDGTDGFRTSHGEFREMSFDENGDISKVYQCSVCSRKFLTFGKCGSHMKRDHVTNRNGQSAKDDLMQGVYTVEEGDADDSGQESQDEEVELDSDKAGREEKVNPEMQDGDIAKGRGEDIEISVNESDNIGEDGDKAKKAGEDVGMDEGENIETEVQKGGEDGSQQNQDETGQLSSNEKSPAAKEQDEKGQGLKRKRQQERVKKSLFYPCTDCDRIFSSPEELNGHMGMEHCGAGRLRCLACASYSSGVGRERHEQLCEEVTKMRQNIIAGVKANNRLNMQHYFECVTCGAAFKIERHFNRHVSHHSKHRCPFCSNDFTTSKSLCVHVNRFHNCGPLKCTLCSQTYHSTKALLKHSLRHGKKFTCSLCSVVFTRKDYLKRHQMIQHKEGKQQKLDCQFCDQVFPYHYLLKLHKAKIHPKEVKVERPQYICPVCGISCRSEASLLMHVPSHDEIYTCQMCSCWFQDAKQLSLHVSRVHEHNTNSPWRKVRQITSGRSARPSKRTAKREGAHQCCFCIKSFTKWPSLMLHEKKHSTQGKYKCGTCGLPFQTFTSLRYHKVKEHNNKSQHMC